MTESLSSGESRDRAGTRDVTEPATLERDLFEQYGPCPACGAETVTYSRAFEESDLTCYTCGHWLDVHETSPRESGDERDDAGTTTLGELRTVLRSLF